MAPASDDRSGIIITFYSYKGGTGRSMALANVGCLLGRRVERGKRCLLIDWDLEAPGLHRYFAETCDSLSARRKRGLVEYFDKLRDLLEEGPNFYRSLAQDRRRTLAKHHPLDDYIVRDVIDNVDLLKAGRVESSEYKRLVNQTMSTRSYSTRSRSFCLNTHRFQDGSLTWRSRSARQSEASPGRRISTPWSARYCVDWDLRGSRRFCVGHP